GQSGAAVGVGNGQADLVVDGILRGKADKWAAERGGAAGGREGPGVGEGGVAGRGGLQGDRAALEGRREGETGDRRLLRLKRADVHGAADGACEAALVGGYAGRDQADVAGADRGAAERQAHGLRRAAVVGEGAEGDGAREVVAAR